MQHTSILFCSSIAIFSVLFFPLDGCALKSKSTTTATDTDATTHTLNPSLHILEQNGHVNNNNDNNGGDATVTPPVLHFTIARRGGAMDATVTAGKDNVDLNFLMAELDRAESRFNLTKREVAGNKLVRKAKMKGSAMAGGEGGQLMGEIAADGIWFATIEIGQPPQKIEMDLNMLVTDFYVSTTNSHRGSRFDESSSHSYVESDKHTHPSCTSPTESFHLPTVEKSVNLEFTHCRPSKASVKALGSSGSTLGLAPSEHLSQTGSTSLIRQLLEREVISQPLFSLMLINAYEGVLSIGGTTAPIVDMVVSQTKAELDRLGAWERGQIAINASLEQIIKRDQPRPASDLSPLRDPVWKNGWAWSKVQGAEGWWQVLMQAVWIDGAKILQNQAVIIDVNCPFILAPPLAAKALYSAVSGSLPLPAPYSNFYAYPCLNPPVVEFEFGGSRYPFMQGGRGVNWTGMPGGKFSLGRWKEGSGYCLGAIVESQMGSRDDQGETGRDSRRGPRSGSSREAMGGNGMKDVWVIGEGFFRGVGGVFDFQDHQVGFRKY